MAPSQQAEFRKPVPDLVFDRLRQFQQTVPVVNSLGYYSPEAGRFLPLDEARGKEAEALRLYAQLEYNALFDKRNRLPMFRTGAEG